MTLADQDEVESICNGGLETYLSSKHTEYVIQRIEEGAAGAIIASFLTIGYSYYTKGKHIRFVHALIPASVGFLGGLIVAGMGYKDNDDEHTLDFNEVCDRVEKDE